MVELGFRVSRDRRAQSPESCVRLQFGCHAPSVCRSSPGVFITLEEPSRPMLTEAASAGYYRSPGWGRDYPRIQILTIAEFLHGAEVKMPPAHGTFKQAQPVQTAERQQLGFEAE